MPSTTPKASLGYHQYSVGYSTPLYHSSSNKDFFEQAKRALTELEYELGRNNRRPEEMLNVLVARTQILSTLAVVEEIRQFRSEYDANVDR